VRDLVIAVLALSLAAVVSVAGVGYLDVGVAGRIEAGSAATAGFRIYGGALTAYRLSNRGLPAEDAWRDELAPYIAGGAPKAPSGWKWSYGRDAAGPWFCFSGADADARSHVLRKTAEAFPAGSVTIAGDCAARPDVGADGVAATYRPIGS
jgi:hypothetical protein